MNSAKEKKISPPEAARRLGVSVEKIHHWIHSGELPAANLARNISGAPRFKIDVEDLEAFVCSRQVVPPAPKTKRRRRETAVKQYV